MPEQDTQGEVERRLSHLLDLARDLLQGPFDVQYAAETIAGKLAGFVGDGATVFLLHDDHTLRAHATAHVEQGLAAAIGSMKETYGLHGPARALHDAVTVGSVVLDATRLAAGADMIRPVLEQLGSNEWLVVPLHDDQARLIGAVRIVTNGVFDPPTIQWAEQVARIGGPMIGRARRSAERALTLDILGQGMAPPELPTVPGLQLQARYRPGTTGFGAGGDWYDVIEVEDRLVLAVGDAAGHGATASIAMNQTRAALRAFLSAGATRRLLTTKLDGYVRSMMEGSMITLCMLEIDPRRRRAYISNAGHMPPMVRSRGTARRLDKGRTPPLGVAVGDRRGSRRRVRFHRDDTVFLYTDGLVERRGETIDHSLARLSWVIEEAPDDLGAACDYILEHLAPSDGYEDDVALLAFRFHRESGVSSVATPDAHG